MSQTLEIKIAPTGIDSAKLFVDGTDTLATNGTATSVTPGTNNPTRYSIVWGTNVPTGYKDQQGQDLYQQVTDLPGIEVEITPYMGEIKCPGQPFRFPLRKFFEDAKAELEAKTNKTEQETAAIDQLQATINRTDVIGAS